MTLMDHISMSPSARRIVLFLLLVLSFLEGCSKDQFSTAPPSAAAGVNNQYPTAVNLSLSPSSPRSLDRAVVTVQETKAISGYPSDVVKISLTMPTMNMGTNITPAHFDGNGKFHATVQFTMPGTWEVIALVGHKNGPLKVMGETTIDVH